MQTVLLDLDGTLIDHFSAIHKSIAYAQAALDLPVSDYETVKATVGGSLPITFGRLSGHEMVEDALPYFNEEFERVMLDDVLVLPGAEWLLQSLYDEVLQLAVFTNKFGNHARAVLNHLNLDRFLAATVGTDDTPFRKPQVEFTAHVLSVLNADPAQTCLIGDSPFDYEAAKAGCLPAYLVATGSHDKAQLLSETDAAGVFPNLLELGASVFNLSN
jgi:phosphoglycolate phosphatase